MAYVVASQTVEIAIRTALGASAGRVRREVLSRAFLLVVAGVAIGGVASLGLTSALRRFLVGVSPFDPVAFGAAATLLVIVGLAAGFVPAVRGSRVAPMHALRRQ
jgi:putative ABC transport system permease protein